MSQIAHLLFQNKTWNVGSFANLKYLSIGFCVGFSVTKLHNDKQQKKGFDEEKIAFCDVCVHFTFSSSLIRAVGKCVLNPHGFEVTHGTAVYQVLVV